MFTLFTFTFAKRRIHTLCGRESIHGYYILNKMCKMLFCIILLYMLEQNSQSARWNHMVATISGNKVANLGRLDMYFNGKKVGQNIVDGMYVSGIVY